MKKILFSAVMLFALGLDAQVIKPAVGIEEENPKATLDVNGDVRVQSISELTGTTGDAKDYEECPCVLMVGKDGKIKRWRTVDALGALGYDGIVNSGVIKPGTVGAGGSGAVSSAELKNTNKYVAPFNDTERKITASSGIEVKIPYTGGTGSYGATNITSTSFAGASEDGGTMSFTLEIQGGTYDSEGYITAVIKPKSDFTYKNITDNTGKKLPIVSFQVKATETSEPVTVALAAVGGIADKYFGDGVHDFIYEEIDVPGSGTWLTMNLGAGYANVRSDKFDPKVRKYNNNGVHKDRELYGSLFQWQRKADGHEFINSEKIGTKAEGYTNVASNIVGKFVLADGDKWVRTDKGGFNLWKKNGENNPCPKGFSVPTRGDMATLITALSGNAYSQDKMPNLPAAGYRQENNGALSVPEKVGYYWTSVHYASKSAETLEFHANGKSISDGGGFRGAGMSVRCKKD